MIFETVQTAELSEDSVINNVNGIRSLTIFYLLKGKSETARRRF
jgi:hypothetical protein